MIDDLMINTSLEYMYKLACHSISHRVVLVRVWYSGCLGGSRSSTEIHIYSRTT
jgi:hypothetical protein